MLVERRQVGLAGKKARGPRPATVSGASMPAGPIETPGPRESSAARLTTMESIAFTQSRGAIDATVDGDPIGQVLGHQGMYGLDEDEWRITARTLQGWMPSDLGLEREEYVTDHKPVIRLGGSYFAARCHKVTGVLVTLPGGDRPEVPAEDVDYLIGYDYIPLLSCGCGGGVGCSHESIAVSFQRTQVIWEHNDVVLSFAKPAYYCAIQQLLVLLGESPRLISEAEWRGPIRTRVVPV
jgi:hypothetical protein